MKAQPIKAHWGRLCAAAMLGLLTSCSAGRELPDEPTVGDARTSEQKVVTADVEAGIREHIDTKTREGGGFFHLERDGEEMRLKLVRIHTEYLATLGPGRHFACVDLVDTKGDVYDVDFWLAGQPGSMHVTETTVHKLNGKPYYLWEQKRDGTWHRVPVAEDAAPALMGVIEGTDEFEFTYRATVPELRGPARMWLPLATSDPWQSVEVLSMKVPGRHRVVDETKHGNQVIFSELSAADAGAQVEIRYRVIRREKSAYEAPAPAGGKYLQAEPYVPLTDEIRQTARKVTEGRETDLVRARALYDHTIDRMKYAKAGPGWGQGDVMHACTKGSGNCTDFHAYFIALARAAGIPARFAIGAGIPSERDDGGVDGYHCWVEFYADGKWWPVDISEADKFSALSTYYFGHHPANRLEFSRGRNLTPEPLPDSGPINFLAYPLVETEGGTTIAPRQFFFQRTGGSKVAAR